MIFADITISLCQHSHCLVYVVTIYKMKSSIDFVEYFMV